jgi:hypothetical protein
MKLNLNLAIFFITLLLSAQTLLAAESVGKVSFVRGSVAAISTTQSSRLLGKDEPIYLGDNLQTSAQSFIIIAFNDGTKITIRPNSSFSINQYSNQPEKKSAEMELHKGGIRASSGKIAQDNPDEFQIKTRLATIKAQQAQYSVRLCENECEKKLQQGNHKKLASEKRVIARIVKIKGKVIAKNNQHKRQKRTLVMGAPLYNGDQLNSQLDSEAVLAFRDGGRITLDEKTEYIISNYHYQQKTQPDKSVHQLIVGGLRILTGYIGKVNKEDYKVKTPVATIGIRGTGFDLYYINRCDPLLEERKRKACQSKKGLYSHVWKGSIYQQNQKNKAILSAPDKSYIASEQGPIVSLAQLPTNQLPIRPDKVSFDEDHLFKTHLLDGTPSGLYVTVHDGYVRLGSSELDLGQNEMAYVGDDREMMRLELQGLLDDDRYPLPSEFDISENEGNYSFLVHGSSPAYECSVE